MIAPLLLLVGLWLAERGRYGYRSAILGAVPRVPKGAGSVAMTAALGPAAMLTTPQGKAAVAKGLVLAQSARNGNPKSRAKVKKIHDAAKRGDPKARQAVAALRAGELVRAQAEEDLEDEESDELDDDQGDEE